MNRIILIGNGFDLAHGLKTSYSDFIDWYWNKKIESITTRTILNNVYDKQDVFFVEDEDISFRLEHWHEDTHSMNEIKTFLKHTSFKNLFLKEITNKNYSNWVDIEEEYFKCLKDIKTNNSFYRDIDLLNSDFERIKLKLDEYLSSLTVENYNPNTYIDIYTPIKLEDFTDKWKNTIIKDLANLISDVKANIGNNNKYIHLGIYNDIRESINDIYSYVKDGTDIEKAIEKIITKFPDIISKYLKSPQNTILLNFNYTNSADSYDRGNDYAYWLSSKTLHIHGELMKDNLENPMIFGYGDELSEDYKKIEDYNDNRFLKNVKSINYLQTDNYSKLLSFIESDKYQIFIMGHSCSNSDRTLLNTLFEHENCASIKVFYHQWKVNKEKITDNYTDIVQNISRNFTQKKKMREIVVNKLNSEPLIKTKL